MTKPNIKPCPCGKVPESIYLAVAFTQYEDSDVICAFADEENAEKFVAACRDYDETREPYPGDEDEVYDPWKVRDEEWFSHHPGDQKLGLPDGYSVMKVSLNDAPRGGGWIDVVDELPGEAQEVLFVQDNKVVFGAWIGGIFWHNNQKTAAAFWMPMPLFGCLFTRTSTFLRRSRK